MPYPELLPPSIAEVNVQQGSDIVVIPYSSYMELDGAVRLSVFSEMTTLAAGRLYRAAATDDTQIIAIGEHTYGRDRPSTTDLMYATLEKMGIDAVAFPVERPRSANATPQQLAWLQRTFSDRWSTHSPILVGHEQHLQRIELLCRLYGISAQFLDAFTYLESVGEGTEPYAQAKRLYDEQNSRYERSSQLLTRATRVLGPLVTTKVFTLLVLMRTPNVVDVAYDAGEAPYLYATTVRRHKRNRASDNTV